MQVQVHLHESKFRLLEQGVEVIQQAALRSLRNK